AAAQTKAQKDATNAFRNCRDMEQFGDATPCWRLYLERHRSAGNEAEIMLAEERVARAPAEPAPPATGESPAEAPPPVAEPPGEPDAPPAEPEAKETEPVAVVPVSVWGPDLCATKGDRRKAVVFGVAKTELLEADAKL